jgi:uncharacterized protein YciI
MKLLLGFFFLYAITVATALNMNIGRRLAFQSKRFSTTMSSGDASELKKYALEYIYVPDILEKRGPYRPEHLELAQGLQKAGKMIGGGPYSPATPGALFVFEDSNDDVVKKFVNDDPYVKNGLVTSWTIKEWNVLIGSIMTSKL